MTEKRILNEVNKTTIRLLLKEPFYGHFLTGLLKAVRADVPTLAVALVEPNMACLCINGRFWEEELQDPQHRYGVVKHEVLHLALRHLLKVRQFSHRQIFNIAADIVVNQYIDDKQLPEGAILLEQFGNLGMKPQMDIGYYYRHLLKTLRKNDPDCASCRRLGQLVKGGASAAHSWLERHEHWHQQMGQLSAAEQRNLEQAIETVIQSAAQRVGKQEAGKLPGELQDYLREFQERQAPALDWRRALRLFASSSNRTSLKNTIRRPSKRYGTTPGIKIRRKQKLLVALDTSGSVQSADIERFFSELYQIWRHGAEVLAVECDTQIKRQYRYRGFPPEFILGRGGTDFNAPLEFANKEYHPDGIIYFTDGYAPVPKVESRYPIMWLITPNGLKEGQGIWEELPGRKVKMM